jgi:uncharacterized membrane protein
MFKATISGHPIHIMLIHFPIAFLPLSALLDIFSIIYQSTYLAELAFYLLVLGTTSGFFAAGFGAIDLIKIKNEQTILKIALLHGGLNVLWLMIFSVIAGIQLKQFPEINILNNWVIILKTLIVVGLFYTNFLGGELVLHYGVGRKN